MQMQVQSASIAALEGSQCLAGTIIQQQSDITVLFAAITTAVLDTFYALQDRHTVSSHTRGELLRDERLAMSSRDTEAALKLLSKRHACMLTVREPLAGYYAIIGSSARTVHIKQSSEAYKLQLQWLMTSRLLCLPWAIPSQKAQSPALPNKQVKHLPPATCNLNI